MERSWASDWQRELEVFKEKIALKKPSAIVFSLNLLSLSLNLLLSLHKRKQKKTPQNRCAVALLAQFYPGKPPETSGVLAWCIAAYVVLTAAAAAFSMVAEGDAFLVTRQPPASAAAPKASSGPAAAAAAAAVAKAAAKEAGPPLPPLRVSSNMARFEPEYELVLKSRRVGSGGGGGCKASSSRNQQPLTKVEARAQLKATSFFRSDGTMDLAALQRDVGALLDEIEAEVSAKGSGGGGGGGSSRGGGAATRSSPRTKKN